MFTRSYKINNSKFSIVFGNILDTKAEVVVSSDDSNISMGDGLYGVSGAIFQKGGEQIQKDARKQLPLSLGDVAVSTAGNWNKKFIFHAITIDYNLAIVKNVSSKEKYFNAIGNDLNIEADKICKYIISKSVKRCLELANTLGIHSIAFPTIGAGAANLPIEEVVGNIIEEIAAFILRTSKGLDIELYIYDNRSDIEIIMNYLKVFERTAVLASDEHATIFESKRLNINQESITNEVPENFIPENVDTMDHDIFISYSRKDAAFADKICKLLEENNLRYWIDRNGYYSGTDYKEIIVAAIKKSKLFIFISSENSNNSQNVYNEIQQAINKNITILPIRIDNASYSDRINYDLLSVDHLEYDSSEKFKEKFIQNTKLRLMK